MIKLAGRAGFEARYAGAAYSASELKDWKRRRTAALGDPRLPAEHRRFLEEVEEDPAGLPRYRGHRAGLDAVLEL